MINNNKKMIIFSDRQLAMIEELKEKTGFTSLSEIIRIGLSMYHKSWFPAYALGKDKDVSEEGLIRQAKVKVKAKESLKEEEEKVRLAPKINICENILGGSVETNENGHKFCRYNMYTLDSEQSQLIPLTQADAILAETSLFIPSREAVFKNRPEVAKRFKNLSKK